MATTRAQQQATDLEAECPLGRDGPNSENQSTIGTSRISAGTLHLSSLKEDGTAPLAGEYSYQNHWQPRLATSTTLPSLVERDVVLLTLACDINKDKAIIMAIRGRILVNSVYSNFLEKGSW